MTLMIASDLHGSPYWTQRLVEAFRREGADRLLLLGDLLDGDARDSALDAGLPDVDDQLNAVKDRVVAVRGNCDTEADQLLLEFPILDDFRLLEVNGLRLYATHGHLWNERFPPTMERGTVLVHGHFHIPGWADHGRWYYVNPGSAALPRGGSARGYVALRDRTFFWKDMDGGIYERHTVR